MTEFNIGSIPETTIAWVAGLIEGEGSFVLGKCGSIQISVPSTDRDVIYYLESILGGHVNMKSNNGNPKWKQQWVFRIMGHGAYAVSMRILPYLGVRRTAQANKLIAHFRNSPRRLMEHNREMIKSGLEQGLTYQEIATQIGSTRIAVTKLISKRRIPHPNYVPSRSRK